MNKQDFKLNIDDQLLDEEFENNINALIAETIYIVNNSKPNIYLSLKDCQIIKDVGRIEAIVSSIVTQMYYDEEKQNYLFLSSSLVRDLAIKHTLYDSNKRTAFFTGKYLLERKNSIRFSIEIEEVKNFVTKVVMMNQENEMNPEAQLKYIQNEILKHSGKLGKLSSNDQVLKKHEENNWSSKEKSLTPKEAQNRSKRYERERQLGVQVMIDDYNNPQSNTREIIEALKDM